MSLLPNPIFGLDLSFSTYFIEYRNGPYTGLKSSIDIWPSVERDISGIIATFEGQRMILSWSWQFMILPEQVYAEINPRIGVWRFKAKLPIEIFKNEYIESEFNTKTALSFGIEGALHLLQPLFKLSTYFGYDTKAFQVEDAADIQSANLGANLFTRFTGVKVNDNIEFQIFIFLFNEQTTVTRPTSNLVEAFDVKANSFEYSMSYTGLGIAYQW